MRKLMLSLATIGLLALPALAATYTYSWDATEADFLGSFNGEMTAAYSLAANHPDGEGGGGLVLTRQTPSSNGVARGFLAAVWNLQEGDEVTFSYWRYDPMSNWPDMRLWAHYNDALVEAQDARGQYMQALDGECYGNNDFGVENGWEQFSHTWTIEAGHTGLVVDAVMYGDFGAQLYVDDISITVPDHASVRLPHAYFASGFDPVPVQQDTWSSVKAIFQ